MHEVGTMRVKGGLAEMLKGGVIMDVVDAEQAKIAEEAGACAVMALERVPADIRRDGGVARMSDPDRIKGIQEAVTIPVMAKCRIGHFAEERRSCRRSRSTTSTSLRYSRPPTSSTTSTSGSSRCRSSVAARTWVRPYGASPRARR